MSAFIFQSSCLSDRKHEKFILGVFECWKWTSNVSVRIESDEWFNEINSILVVLNVLASFYLSFMRKIQTFIEMSKKYKKLK